MAEASDMLGIVYQNLKDAGCDSEEIEKMARKCIVMCEGSDL